MITPRFWPGLRMHLPNQPSWSAVRKMLRGRMVAVGGVLCLDEARRLSRGETVTVSDQPLAPPPRDDDVKVRFIDKQIVVVEKPAGMLTLRRKSEYAWPWKKRNLQHYARRMYPSFDRGTCGAKKQPTT